MRRPSSPGARGWFVAAAVLIPLIMVAAYIRHGDSAIPRNLEAEALTARFHLRGAVAPGPATAVVMVDDRTIAELGRWPLSRAKFAEATRRLKADGARVIAFDLLFTEPEDAAVDTGFGHTIAEAGNVLIPMAFLFGDPDGGGVGGAEAISKKSEPPPMPAELTDGAYGHLRLPDGYSLRLPVTPVGVVVPLPVIAEGAAAVAHVSVLYDTDGTPRYDYPVLEYDWSYYPSLPLAAARMWLGLSPDQVEVRFGEGIALGGRLVPTDEDMRQLVNYLGPARTIPTHSFADVLAGRVPPGTFRDKLVVIGANVLGIDDSFKSPYSLVLPGAERQAMVMDQILSGRPLIRRDWVRLVDMAAILAMGLSAAVLAAALPSALMVPGGAALLAGWALACQLAFHPGGVWLNSTFPAATIVLVLGCVYVVRARREERERRAAEGALRISEERYALAARGANDGLWDWDIARNTIYFAPRWQAMVGLDEAAITAPPEHWLSRLDPVDRPLLEAAIEAHLEGRTRHLTHEYRLYHTDGEPRWMLARGEVVRDAEGCPTRLAGSQTDVTERCRAEAALLESAFRDPLTGLANRAVLLDRLEQALAHAARGDAAAPTLIDINIDGFRRLVETLGPLATDRILAAVARRLEALTGPGDTLARLGGDGFALLTADDGGDLDTLAGKVHAALAEPLVVDGREVPITVSVGIATAESPLMEPAELLRDSALAGHAAREEGPGRSATFTAAMRSKVDRRFELEAEMRSAFLEGGEDYGAFELFYQPIVTLPDRRIDGFEALMRWRHPVRGLVSPGEFIPIAEETGLIVPLGRWAIQEVCRRVVAWRALTGVPLVIAVNVSGRQFTESDLLADVTGALEATAAPPEALKLEVTESMVMNDPERAAGVLRTLMAMGVKVSIDDFGTGYSSLAYLHKLPFTTLKIDRSFVIRMGEGPEGLAIVRTIVALAKTLGRDLVAEGIEHDHHAHSLSALQVDHGQGFLFSKPLPAGEAEALLVVTSRR